jgi:aspartyl protease family protein
MTRFLAVLFVLVATASVVAAYRDPEQVARASDTISDLLRKRASTPSSTVHVPRAQGGEFAIQAKINGVPTPMVIDTGATSVVLTYEAAKAIGLPLELLEYDVDVETAGGHTKAARLTLDRLAIGKLVERAVPALVVPRGQMKVNLLGMSFLDRLESWEVRGERLVLHGFPEPAAGAHSERGRRTVVD